MIDTYIINLEKCIEKKSDILKNIKSNEIDNYLNIKFIKGIDGSNLSLDEQSQFKICPLWMDFKLKTGITTGEIGCALSHYKAWKEFYESKNEHAIFLEDDVYFNKNNFNKNLKYLLTYPEDTDIIYILRKQLYDEKDVNSDKYKYFKEIKASYWLCAYLLTYNGVKKLLNCNYLDNLIVVDEFIPILYDNSYLKTYQKFYNTSLKAYSLKNKYSFINLKKNAFFESNTFHTNYYEFDSQIITLTTDKNVSYSSLSRFIKTCKKFSIQYKIINMEELIQNLNNIDNNKYIIILNCKYSFFINNPLKLIIDEEKDLYYSNFVNLSNLLENYENNSLYFFGKKYVLIDLLNNSNNIYTINTNSDDIIKKLSKDDSLIENTKDSIIINGINNKLLLNKFENYDINKIHKSYGYKNINKNNKYEYKICVNVMIYEYNSLECLNILNIIDYAKELLDINIYTLDDLKINTINNSFNINNMSELEAYKQIYNIYSNYDYIWFIYSNTILTEPSILKNYIDSEKMIVSGLTLRKNTTFSNFWGDITSSGWYSRSDDYLDIINRKKINIWNVPYINGNIFFNKKIFDKYNLLNNNIFNDLDMKICHNLRFFGEGMFLLNQELYGYILPENIKIIQDTPININDWQLNKIFSSEYLKFYNDDDMSILKEIKKNIDIWCFPFFTPEFCDYLVNLAEYNNIWSGGVYTKQDTIDKRIGTVENIPTQDIHLKDLNLESFWLEIIKNHFKKIMSKLYHYKTKDYNIAFIVKYDAEKGQTNLQPHHDASVYTTNIALSNGSDYDGGGVKFHSKNITFYNKNKGYICIHPGKITHYHEALSITRGKRYILVSFNN